MITDNVLKLCRGAAASYFRAQGYETDAEYVEAGLSDETREVKIAIEIYKILHQPKSPPTKYNGRRIIGE